ncbi:hypothetical protein SKAU_G00411060 [Synaphobranchus kaupii]|uniref:SGNH hydrolase-type esterase domain-containing protein n=1 Tax=Synaphobranchus kaupii TaxID=118154 RepID=A0A9Q1E7V7_SYNKA|nr:hypothetical protein SKAU_G00411060 [Synaphobranchus kaupii]
MLEMEITEFKESKLQETDSVQQPPKTAILIDSNDKFLNHRRLFPTHSVGKFWCPTTDNALKLLCQSTLNTPQNILIHTGTNDLRSKGEKVAEPLKKVAEKAHRLFPQANIAISTLLPRRDYPGGLINKINQSITSDCATLHNVTIIHHPALSCDHLYDLVHLDQEGVRLFAKDLRDLQRPTHPPAPQTSSTPPSPVLCRLQEIPPPTKQSPA